MRTFVVLLLTAGLGAGFFMPASAQPICGPRDAILDGLRARHGEVVIWAGEAMSGGYVELFQSQQRTWSLAVTTGRHTCLFSAGEAGQQFLMRFGKSGEFL